MRNKIPIPTLRKTPAPGDASEAIVHNRSVSRIGNMVASNASAQELLRVLQEHRDQLRATEGLLKSNPILQRLQRLSRFRRERWSACASLMDLVGAVAAHRADADSDLQRNIGETVSDIAALIHNTESARDSYFEVLFGTLQGLEEEQGTYEMLFQLDEFEERAERYMDDIMNTHTLLQEEVMRQGGKVTGAFV